jgi:DNA-binding NarL/FixJ family response regulator
MAKYKILFVDEVDTDIRRFQRYVHRKDTEKKFELIVKMPENTLENFMNEIVNENFDAIITDHKLHEENANISFDGIDLVREILSNKIGFPCFVLTSFDDEAVIHGDDVNIVYIKGLMDSDGENKAHATFLDKIENQIKHYRKRIQNSEKELLNLIEKSQETALNAQEEEKLLELDTFIEKSTNQPSSLPKHLKSTNNLDELHKMINNTDALLNKLRELKND